MPQPPEQHRPGTRPSHFPPPSSEETSNSRLPAEGGSSSGWISAPPPTGARPDRLRAAPAPEDGYPHTHRSGTKAPAPPSGRSFSPSLTRQARQKDHYLLLNYNHPPVIQGGQRHSGITRPLTLPSLLIPPRLGEPTSLPASQAAEQPPFSSAG